MVAFVKIDPTTIYSKDFVQGRFGAAGLVWTVSLVFAAACPSTSAQGLFTNLFLLLSVAPGGPSIFEQACPSILARALATNLFLILSFAPGGPNISEQACPSILARALSTSLFLFLFFAPGGPNIFEQAGCKSRLVIFAAPCAEILCDDLFLTVGRPVRNHLVQILC